jgi:hypothetical protein
MSLDLANQTNLVPSQFLAINPAETQSVGVNVNGIVLENTTTGRTLAIGAGGFLADGTITIDPLNLSAITDNPTPQQLVINNDLIVQDDDTAPDNIINIQAGVIGVGTNFGIDYESSTNQDFTIQTINSNTGGVVFKQYGLGATTTQSKIKQGIITCSNTANTNSITIDASNNNIVITDGTNTNTINQNGYSTKNSTQNLTHYLNFSDSSSSGIGAIQKTAGLSCNPSTNTITATTFVGDLSGNAMNATNCSTTSTTTAGTYYPVFVSSNVSGNYPNLVGVMTYNPSSNTITANTFNGALSGTATNATNAVIGTDNASTLVYPTFVKTSGAGNKGLFIDDTTTPLTFNPSTGALTTTSFVASGGSSTNTIGSSSMVIANAGGTLTINQGQVSTTASTFNVNAGTSLQLQIASSTLVGLNTTALTTYKPIYLDDNSSHQSILNANWFGTASVNSTNIYQPSVITKELNIGALGSAGSITKYPFTTTRNYATTTQFYTSSTDATPLQLTGTDFVNIGTKLLNITTAGASTKTTLGLSASNTATGAGGSCVVNLESGTNTTGVGAKFSVSTYNPNTAIFSTLTADSGTSGGVSIGGRMETTLSGEYNQNYGYSNGNALSSVYANEDSGSECRMDIDLTKISFKVGSVGSPAEVVSINSSGVFVPNTLQLPTTSTSVNFSGAITFNAQSKSLPFFYINATGTTNTITGYSFVNYPLNAVAQVAIYNGGSGNLTFNKVAGIRANFASTFVVPAGGYANMVIKYLYYGTASYYSLEATNYTT